MANKKVSTKKGNTGNITKTTTKDDEKDFKGSKVEGKKDDSGRVTGEDVIKRFRAKGVKI